MPPQVIHFVRHAQGFHNVVRANHQIHDPALTSLGEDQCHKLRGAFPAMDQIDLVVASPLRRTLNTALLSFLPLFEKRGIQIVALPDVQEIADTPCDTGTEPQLLKQEFAGKPLDFSLVVPGWNCNTGVYGPATEQLAARAKRAREWLFAREEREIVVVTHGGFLHYLTEDWSDVTRFRDTGWANTEFRSYTFKEPAGDNVSLVETGTSRERRAGTEHPLSAAEKTQLQRNMEKDAEMAALKISNGNGVALNGHLMAAK